MIGLGLKVVTGEVYTQIERSYRINVAAKIAFLHRVTASRITIITI